MQQRVTTTTTKKVEGYITGDDIKNMFGLPSNASVFFSVPGGGDWCNTNIDITREDPIYVTWTIEEES